MEKGKQFVSVSNETPSQRKRRWLSIKILCLTMFFDSLSFSIVLSSIWPYLQKVGGDPNLTPIYAGWANVGFQLAGIFIDFIIGHWTNKRGSTEPILISLIFFGVGNFLYGYAEAFGSFGVPMIILSRTLIGLSTGVDVVSRVVLAESTTLKERTSAMAYMSIAHGLGFSFGPAVQLATIPLGDKGVYISTLRLYLNLYTAPAFASILIAIANIAIVIGWYQEFHVDIYKDHEGDESINKYKKLLRAHGLQNTKADPIAIIATLVLYFVGQSAFGLYETILTPLAMDELAWNGEETALYVGLLFLAAGIIAVFTFGISDLLEKRFNERLILLAGFLLVLLGFISHLPWGTTFPKIKPTVPSNATSEILQSAKELVGCPEEYNWCTTTPQIKLPQFIIGMIFLSIGYPFILVMTTTIYSKILGPKPQGIMQSWFAATGGAARTIGPALVTYAYVEIGPRWTFFSVDGLLMISTVLLILAYKKLIPYHLFVLRKNKAALVTIDDDKLALTGSLSSDDSAYSNNYVLMSAV
ncbi:major facilitator superfamily domain-containing protein 8-like isoform X2 [Hydractinia symbiolongicarpus]|uniref:major facilitator superfamily domain-containing protein 8-like isoform X2 n=1 Tax=Hydractinia symbiolongicarpus TaxID=13093 RepID=UPI00254B0126|nr:major facilitator superfamily domain-containing protein 8-like isoform X2 [Hydractinia symbiolongicarpus]